MRDGWIGKALETHVSGSLDILRSCLPFHLLTSITELFTSVRTYFRTCHCLTLPYTALHYLPFEFELPGVCMCM